MRYVIVQLAVTSLILLYLSESTKACTCLDSPSPCVSFQSTPVVFVGIVKSIKEETAEINQFGNIEKVRISLSAHFIVEEALKDISTQEVDVITGCTQNRIRYSVMCRAHHFEMVTKRPVPQRAY